MIASYRIERIIVLNATTRWLGVVVVREKKTDSRLRLDGDRSWLVYRIFIRPHVKLFKAIRIVYPVAWTLLQRCLAASPPSSSSSFILGIVPKMVKWWVKSTATRHVVRERERRWYSLGKIYCSLQAHATRRSDDDGTALCAGCAVMSEGIKMNR